MNANIGVRPHQLAIIPDTGIPSIELLERDIGPLGDNRTALTGLDEVELVTVFHHARHPRGRSGNTVTVACSSRRR